MNSKSDFKYKKSEITWLPLIPTHWNTLKGKRLFTKMNRLISTSDEVVTCFRDGTVTLRKNRRLRGFTESIKEIGYQGIKKGDLVIHVMDAFAGAIGVSDSDGKATPVYSVCKPKLDLNPYFYALIVREMARIGFITSLAKGIRERSTDFRFETFAAQLLPLPPIEEQNAVASFIDWKTRQISKFIQKKKQVITLLKEQKQAIINKAVTRGLDPNVNLKPSGVEWLGDIPEHWQIKKLKYFVKNHSEQVENKRFDEIYIALEHVESWTGKLNVPEEEIRFDSLVKRFAIGDILFGKLRPYLAKVIQADQKGVCVGEFLVLRKSSSDVTTDFLEILLRSKRAIDLITASTFGAKMPRADWNFIGNLPIPYPPEPEQIRITAFLKANTEKIDKGISFLLQQINLIQEYRTRLISDVVTGQINVQNIELGEVDLNGFEDDILEDDQDEESLELIGASDDD